MSVSIHLRFDWWTMAACTYSVSHEHWKAIAAFEFVKRKAVTALLTASRSILRILGHILGRSASRCTSKCLTALIKVIVASFEGCCNLTAFRKRQFGIDLPCFTIYLQQVVHLCSERMQA